MKTPFTNLPFEEYQGIARILYHLLSHYPEAEMIHDFIHNDVAASWPTFASEGQGRDGNRVGREALSHFLQQWDDSQLTELQLDYGQLFFGPGEPKAIPQGSVYLGEEQLLNDRSTVALMDYYKVHGVELQMANRQPVDHIGFFFAVLDSTLGRLEQERTNEELKQFVQLLLGKHLLPWSGRCLELAAEHAQTEFYFGVALLAEDFLKQLANDFNVVPVSARLFR
ncbi:molecular chaperone TorD family protein [Shewanella corallii]|uniref:Molecular chaperone TorD family protein n=1 Tax=Shewanella corallii TaxID=560080 RepID=A0ABT0N9X4_9GAMM|nr:molecular chaperone TorD family protein [Shewanella corallii]MCL2915228.1 molecular chaperone TorD family protein [Shewanella corallii]